MHSLKPPACISHAIVPRFSSFLPFELCRLFLYRYLLLRPPHLRFFPMVSDEFVKACIKITCAQSPEDEEDAAWTFASPGLGGSAPDPHAVSEAEGMFY